MTVKRTKFGPGTLTLDPQGTLDAPAGPQEISCQVSSGGVQHEYEDSGDSTTMLCGTEVSDSSASRRDSLTFDHLADLSAGGLYAFLLAHDLADCPFSFQPAGADGPSWTGIIQLRLPDTVTADEYGQPLSGTVTWPGVGAFDFTPTPAG